MSNKEQMKNQTTYIPDEFGSVHTVFVPKEIQVEHPSHYNQGNIECIEALRSALGPEGYKGFCAGNIIKYTWRYNGKDGIKDIKKVKAYADYLIEELEEEENNG